ncbi:hypotheticall protein [Colletotrichum viniferum]|nr:hypotheticall protein [Colletotrichum viniferum]
MPSCQPPDAFANGGTAVTACAHSADARDFHRKRIVICCDGTWNNSNAEGRIQTNVGRLATVVAHKCCNGMPQVVYYHRGVGTEQSLAARALGGLFGQGVVADIADVYRFVCENYNYGDELIFTGFSRGAFTARSVANMYKMIVCEEKDYRNYSTLGEILKSINDPWVPAEIEVKAVGVWDTVGSLGMPYSLSRMGRSADQIRFGSQDVHERIQHAFHALALDEYRKPFKPTLWSRDISNKNTHLRQVWFPGSHSDVGGGLANQQMATIAFALP